MTSELPTSSPRIVRREAPPPFTGADGYRKAREYLRRDFDQRCAYCTIHERHAGGLEHFWIDHFRPLSAGGSINGYDNLYWSCMSCNHIKGSQWPSTSEFANGYRFADPCREQDYGYHFQEDSQGLLAAQTRCGEYHIARLLLNREARVRDRIRKRQIQARITEARHLLETVSEIMPAGYADMIRSLVNQLEQDI